MTTFDAVPMHIGSIKSQHSAYVVLNGAVAGN